MKSKYFRFISLGIMVAVMVIIFIFSSQNSQESFEVSGKVSRAIHAKQYGETGVVPAEKSVSGEPYEVKNYTWVFGVNTRKIAHISLFFLLGIFAYFGLKPGRFRGLWVLLIGYLYACSDEFHQSFCDRSALFTDTLYDLLGVAFAVLLCRHVTIAYEKYTVWKRSRENG